MEARNSQFSDNQEIFPHRQGELTDLSLMFLTKSTKLLASINRPPWHWQKGQWLTAQTVLNELMTFAVRALLRRLKKLDFSFNT